MQSDKTSLEARSWFFLPHLVPPWGLSLPFLFLWIYNSDALQGSVTEYLSRSVFPQMSPASQGHRGFWLKMKISISYLYPVHWFPRAAFTNYTTGAKTTEMYSHVVWRLGVRGQGVGRVARLWVSWRACSSPSSHANSCRHPWLSLAGCGFPFHSLRGCQCLISDLPVSLPLVWFVGPVWKIHNDLISRSLT